ncbi:SRPBCC domain-containing protein [Candidatus Kaiserbacteria bacterium]|nr:SRPBCC domain-containing protein [Candidatus Kaiserbacteria bacterium]
MADVRLTITRTFDAKPEEVFEAWIDPKMVAQWYGPEGFTNEIHEFDAREGGVYHLTMKGPNGETHPLRGVFKTIQRPTKLVLTWQWQNGEAWGTETIVTVEFKAMGNKTEMTMMHSGFADEKQKEMHDQGWSSSFGKLDKVVG